MTIGGKQSIRHNKSGARNAGAQCGALLGKSDLVNAEDITNRIAVPVQDHGRHGLFLLQLVYLQGKLLYLLMKSIGRGWPIVVAHETCPHEQEHAQHPLHQPLPGGTDRFFFRLNVVGHEGKAACAAGEEIRSARQACEPLYCSWIGDSPRVRREVYGWGK